MIGDPSKLTLEAIADDTITNSDVSVSMWLIVTELVINAIKHAFPDQTVGGKIIVAFEQTREPGCFPYPITDQECRLVRSAESRALAQESLRPCRSNSKRA